MLRSQHGSGYEDPETRRRTRLSPAMAPRENLGQKNREGEAPADEKMAQVVTSGGREEFSFTGVARQFDEGFEAETELPEDLNRAVIVGSRHCNDPHQPQLISAE